MDVDECISQPCQNGATCIDAVNRYTCACVRGYEDTHCETEIWECASNPCQHEGTCHEAINMYTCTCLPGYEGLQCQTDTDECASNPCQNGGSCSDEINRYLCTCVSGFRGTNCEIEVNECDSNPCQNVGVCTDGFNSFTCSCAAGFEGTTCDTNSNECSSGPCQNGGNCADGVNGYTCSCAPGYVGIHCETNNNECASNPCQHGGACTDHVNYYSCSCQAGVDGTNCETVSSVTIRLAAGSSVLNGRLEVYWNGAWGTVCDDSFDGNDAAVVCRQLGFTNYSTYGFVSAGTGDIVMDDLACTGSESNLAQCGHAGYLVENCRHTEDIAVTCASTQIRLTSGSYGRVEIYYQGAWGTVCDDLWDNNDAAVVCRMLGYSGGTANASYGAGNSSQTIVLDNVECNGTEIDIGACSHNAYLDEDCEHNQDAGDAIGIPLVAAHRLQQPKHTFAGNIPDLERQPPAIIVRFARMIDWDRLLNAYERRPRQPRQQPTPPGTVPVPAPSAYPHVAAELGLGEKSAINSRMLYHNHD
ncbi:uncharacterized protein [Diadema setosum]|uniref:uncharacterized protein n=1 Tax=Diadema setosum TaxID=31175 RepID=UPI003B3ACDC9